MSLAPGVILGMGSANERPRYNDPWALEQLYSVPALQGTDKITCTNLQQNPTNCEL